LVLKLLLAERKSKLSLVFGEPLFSEVKLRFRHFTAIVWCKGTS
jgi:hypothetical protein